MAVLSGGGLSGSNSHGQKFHAAANCYKRITTYCTSLPGMEKIVEGSMCPGSL